MDSNAVFAVLLLIAGIGILSAEIFIPTGGLLGIVTFLTLSCSLMFAWRAWGNSHVEIFWSFCGVLLLLVPTAIGTAFYILPQTATGKRMLLEAPLAEDLTPFMQESKHLMELVGDYGRTASPLTPGGFVLIHGERLHAISDGLIIESGQSVEVLGVRGSRLLVRAASPPAPTAAALTERTSPLDFEFPQG
jgi:membrane-bound serine protease (ClpP class)